MVDIDDPRRRFLINALTAGCYAVGSLGLAMPVWAMGKMPHALSPGKSIYDLKGSVWVDGRPATLDSRINPDSMLETGADSRLIFVLGKDAFILRDNSTLILEGSKAVITGLRLLGGKLLSVFGQRPPGQILGIKTVVATIGIRGTGLYIEAEPDRSYVCTCYGVADLIATDDILSRERIVTVHHDAPRYILKHAPAGEKITAAPVINHKDDELTLIEALVGRTVPYSFTENYF